MGDVVNKAKLFDNQLKGTRHIFGSKVIIVLVDYRQRMERFLEEMRMFIADELPETPPHPIMATP